MLTMCEATKRWKHGPHSLRSYNLVKKYIDALIQNNPSIKETIQYMQIDGMKKESKAFIYTF